MGRTFATAAKAATTIAIVWVLLNHVDLRPVVSRLLHVGPLQIAIGLLPLAIQLTFAAERWRIVCDRLGVSLGFVPALRITTIGSFFNQTLPSAVGGDAMRVWLLVRNGIGLGKAVNTVLCDRVFALVILIGLTGVTLPLFYRQVPDLAARHTLTALVAIGFVGFVVFLTSGNAIAKALRAWKFSRPFGDLAKDFHLLFGRTTTTAGLTVLSVIIHLLTVIAAWLIAELLGIGVALQDCLIIVPPVVLITMLPFSIAGWGLREGAMVVGFGLVGVAPSDALAISICLGLASIIVGLPGGLLWLWTRQVPAAEIAPADAG